MDSKILTEYNDDGNTLNSKNSLLELKAALQDELNKYPFEPEEIITSERNGIVPDVRGYNNNYLIENVNTLQLNNNDENLSSDIEMSRNENIFESSKTIISQPILQNNDIVLRIPHPSPFLLNYYQMANVNLLPFKPIKHYYLRPIKMQDVLPIYPNIPIAVQGHVKKCNHCF